MSYRVSDVFVPGGLPKHTYVSRKEHYLEDRVRSAKENLCKIVTVTGSTKAGKTVLVKRIFSDSECIWLDGGSIESMDDFWELMSDQLSVVVEEACSETDGDESEDGEEASLSSDAIIIKGGGSIQKKERRSHHTTKNKRVVKSRKGQTLLMLKSRRVTIVIDDFHYLSRELQGKITRILKPLVFEGVPVVYLAIPHRRYDAIRVEREMNGRVAIVGVPSWSIEELSQIAQLGFPLLNVRPDSSISTDLAREAQGSPHLMQEFCKDICVKSRISETVPSPLEINARFPFDEIYRDVAANLGKNIFDRLARGPRQRKDRKMRRLRNGRSADIYSVVLFALADLKPGVETVEYEPLRLSIRGVLEDDLPQAQEVSRVLEHMAKISSTDESSVPVIDYEKDERKLHITDPFFAFFLRWGRGVIEAST